MEIINDQLLRKSLGISKDVPVYYLSEKVIVHSIKKMLEESELSGNDFYNQDIDYIIDSRPFDEVVIIETGEMYESKHFFYHISHFTKDGRYRSFTKQSNLPDIKNETIRENFDILNIDIERDTEEFRLNKIAAIRSLSPFSVKKNRISLAEGKSKKQGKGNKYKKAKFLYVTSDTYEARDTKNVRVHDSFQCGKWAGHKRHYHKYPETKGHDRNENEVIGWTWVSPYNRGEGKEIQNKIRKFLS